MARPKSEKPLTGAERQRKYRKNRNLTTLSIKLDATIAYDLGLLSFYHSVTKKELLEKWIKTEVRAVLDNYSGEELTQLLNNYAEKRKVKDEADITRSLWQKEHYSKFVTK